MQGKVSGLDVKPSSGMPGASSQITIRGARSFSGDNTPLYVIEGMPVTSTPDVSTDIQNNGSVSGADFANRAVDIDPNAVSYKHLDVYKRQPERLHIPFRTIQTTAGTMGQSNRKLLTAMQHLIPVQR